MAAKKPKLKELTPAELWALVQKIDSEVHELWEQLDRLRLRLVRAAKMGRKWKKTIAISETKGVQITNKFKEKGAMKVFAPAFAKKYDFKEVTLDD